MQHYRIDLAEWLAAGRYGALIDYLQALPGACRWRAALLDDPQQAEHFAALPDDDGDEAAADRWRPSHAEFSLGHMMLAEISDKLGQLVSLGAQNYTARPFPRPSTLSQEMRAAARERRRRQQIAQNITLFAPHAMDAFQHYLD